MDYFTGQVHVDPLFAVSEQLEASGAYVTFESGARSAWHTHPAGQRLIVTSGVGLTQEWGKPKQEIHPGDVVWCPPGIKHWHGATPSSAMTHVAVTGSVDGKTVTWMEKVSDEQYDTVSAASADPRGHEAMAADATLSVKQQAIPLIAASMINQYLRAHLFGAIFERDNLDWQSRELATVGALAATPGAESQLRSHMAASMRVGLTREQLRQGIEVLAERGETRAAKRATEALTQALATMKGSE